VGSVRALRELANDVDGRVRTTLQSADAPTRLEQLLAIAIDALVAIHDRLALSSGPSASTSGDDEPLTLAQIYTQYPALSKSRLYDAMSGTDCKTPLRYVQFEPSGTRFIRRGELQRWIRAHEIGGAI
jgi:hypothetical protein